MRIDSARLQNDREGLAGSIATVPGYLVSARMIGSNACFKVLVDETLQYAPQLLMENAGSATEATARESREVSTAPVESPSLRAELARADARVAPAAAAAVIQACKRPPTSANKRVLEHALEWLDPLAKPERIENAPDVASLRRELQLFYLERSRRYGWARLPWDEVVVTGVVLSEDARFEDEIVGGVDLVPLLVSVYDSQREHWLVLDLTVDDGVAKELMFGVFGKQIPRLARSTVGF